MKILVISDTHGVLKENLKSLILECDHVIHAGDIGSMRVYQELRALNQNTYFVKGNCDHGVWAAELPVTLLFHLDGILFYVIHNRMDLAFRPNQADIIISGHTHRYSEGKYMKSTLLNPGSCGQPRGSAATCAVITTQEGDFRIKRVVL